MSISLKVVSMAFTFWASFNLWAILCLIRDILTCKEIECNQEMTMYICYLNSNLCVLNRTTPTLTPRSTTPTSDLMVCQKPLLMLTLYNVKERRLRGTKIGKFFISILH